MKDKMIRKMKKKDINIIHGELNNLSDRDKCFFHPFEFTLENIRNLLELDYDNYYVAEIDNEIVGYSHLRTFGKYKIPTYGGVIWRRFRNKGYGTKMLEEVLEDAKRLNYESVKLKVYKDNNNALKLYRDYGFRIIGMEGKEWWMEK